MTTIHIYSVGIQPYLSCRVLGCAIRSWGNVDPGTHAEEQLPSFALFAPQTAQTHEDEGSHQESHHTNDIEAVRERLGRRDAF